MNNRFSYRAGFSLIELLVACALLVALAAWTVPAFMKFSDRQELLRAEELARTEIYTVQNRAVANVDRGVGEFYWWGVKFDAGSTRYVFYRSPNDADPMAPAEPALYRENHLASDDLEFADGATVWFRMTTGEVFGGDQTVVVRRVGATCTSEADPSDDCREVNVYTGGRIE